MCTVGVYILHLHATQLYVGSRSGVSSFLSLTQTAPNACMCIHGVMFLHLFMFTSMSSICSYLQVTIGSDVQKKTVDLADRTVC